MAVDKANIINKDDSQLIHTLRFPLVCLVVIIHGFSFINGWEISQFDIGCMRGADYYSFFCISLSMTLAHIAVPTFSFFLVFFFLKDWILGIGKYI